MTIKHSDILAGSPATALAAGVMEVIVNIVKA
jgi:hypothetical protein